MGSLLRKKHYGNLKKGIGRKPLGRKTGRVQEIKEVRDTGFEGLHGGKGLQKGAKGMSD